MLKSIDRSVECTSSVLQALIMFREIYPGYRKEEIGKCIKNASVFIENSQRKDGSWYLKYFVCRCQVFELSILEVNNCLISYLIGMALGVYVSLMEHYLLYKD